MGYSAVHVYDQGSLLKCSKLPAEKRDPCKHKYRARMLRIYIYLIEIHDNKSDDNTEETQLPFY